MAKQEVEWSNRLPIFFLKKNGYLPKDGGCRSGVINWSYNDENKSSIGFIVNISGSEGNYIRLQYTHTDRWSEEKESLDYKVELTTTPCNYGGVRYWFICPLSKNGQYCGRRVGVIYSIGKWFGCRHCGDICYAAQMRGGKYRWNGVSVPDIEKAEKEIKRYYYNGKPTRKYRRLIRLNEKFEMGLITMGARLDKRLARVAELAKKYK